MATHAAQNASIMDAIPKWHEITILSLTLKIARTHEIRIQILHGINKLHAQTQAYRSRSNISEKEVFGQWVTIGSRNSHKNGINRRRLSIYVIHLTYASLKSKHFITKTAINHHQWDHPKWSRYAEKLVGGFKQQRMAYEKLHFCKVHQKHVIRTSPARKWVQRSEHLWRGVKEPDVEQHKDDDEWTIA